MPIVINEFEVTPAEPQAANGAPAATGEHPGGHKKDAAREVDRQLQRRALRASRLRAV